MLFSSKNTKILKIAVCLFIATTAIFLLANFALAASADLGLNYAAGTGLSNVQDIRVTIAKIIRIIIGFLGIIAVGLIMYAGWIWMTSEGNEEKIEQAKKILKNAVIGLIIILSAFAIVSFIINRLGGGGGGPGVPPGGGPEKSYGLSALGNGIIESHYPARDQKEVPRNTSIIISFREPMLAKTLCKTPDTAKEAICNNDDINEKVVRIFRKNEHTKCTDTYTPSSGCTSLAEAKVYSSANGKTFVFVPTNYLGSPSEYIDYMVYLDSGLLRQSGEKAFPGLEKEYAWSFEVSNKIDLTPPQVKQNGVVPAPDNFKDTIMPGIGKQAEGTITVKATPSISQDASVSVTEQGGTPAAGAEVNKDCPRNGNFNIAIANGPVATLYQGSINLGQGTFSVISGGYKQVVFSECNLTLTMAAANTDFAAGYLWAVALSKATAADTVTVGNITYTASSAASGNNFKAGPTNGDTADSIAAVINSNNPDVAASPSGNVATVKAKIAGAAGNSLNLSSSNDTALEVGAMAGGTDKENKVTINGEKDQPMNSAIEIVFNEAIMPLVVSGTADDLKDYIRVVNADPAAKPTAANPGDKSCTVDADCKSFVCDKGECTGANDYLKGKFAVSNQYKTVDFLSDKECGFNACGEKIYCLPANSHLRVELSAANLMACADDTSCQAYSPFNICDATRKFCRDSNNNYFPQAKKGGATIVDGIIDAAFNSLDGNRDDSAYGPASFYNENTTPPDISKGDSFQRSFYISKLLDLTPPKIKTTTPAIDGSAPDLIEALKISFDKLMLSSRLTTGSLTIPNGKENILHYLLNLRSFVDQPLGYWVTNEGVQSVAGGAIDRTDAYINHSPFSGASTYKAQAGSGLKDIYQNCYLPCAGPACTGVTSEKPCCCNGVLGTSCP